MWGGKPYFKTEKIIDFFTFAHFFPKISTTKSIIIEQMSNEIEENMVRPVHF